MAEFRLRRALGRIRRFFRPRALRALWRRQRELVNVLMILRGFLAVVVGTVGIAFVILHYITHYFNIFQHALRYLGIRQISVDTIPLSLEPETIALLRRMRRLRNVFYVIKVSCFLLYLNWLIAGGVIVMLMGLGIDVGRFRALDFLNLAQDDRPAYQPDVMYNIGEYVILGRVHWTRFFIFLVVLVTVVYLLVPPDIIG